MVKEILNNLGINIKNIREQKGFTQSYVSEKLGYKSPSIISEIEKNKKGIDARKIPSLATILGVSIEEIFFDL